MLSWVGLRGERREWAHPTVPRVFSLSDPWGSAQLRTEDCPHPARAFWGQGARCQGSENPCASGGMRAGDRPCAPILPSRRCTSLQPPPTSPLVVGVGCGVFSVRPTSLSPGFGKKPKAPPTSPQGEALAILLTTRLHPIRVPDRVRSLKCTPVAGMRTKEGIQ